MGAIQHHLAACKLSSFSPKIYISQSSDRKETNPEVTTRTGTSPPEDFGRLALAFRRRLLVGIGSASTVALGANFLGISSFILGIWPEAGRNLKLDLLYPIGGYSRFIDTNEGFEFVYPSNWVRDQTLLYRAIGKAELERSLDPPPLIDADNRRHRQNVNEPVIAFGPPGSSGELNVSVIVSPVPFDFSIEAFGGPNDVGEAVVKTITGSGRRDNVKGALIESTIKEDSLRNVKYYKLEYKVESPSFYRHNVAVCCAFQGRLFTVNAQAPELLWQKVKSDFYTIADSFNLTAL